MTDPLRALPLADLHEELGATFAPFAGYRMPVQYPRGVLAEHHWTRAGAGLFDVSHMGQIVLPKSALAALEALVPADLLGLPVGRQRYGLLTAPAGGVLDDLMIAHRPDDLFLVVNAGRKAADFAHLSASIPEAVLIEDRALLAVQGPDAEAVLSGLLPEVAAMRFMEVATAMWRGAPVWLSRSGYTGEDGFEISLPLPIAEAFARAILADERVAPIGLGARDSLRLEAGLPLYGQEMTEAISPVEAGQAWAIGKARRRGGAREGGFPGAEIILDQIENGPPRRRVGLRPVGRAPMRAGVALFAATSDADPVGQITSGGYGPSVEGPIALGLVGADLPAEATLYGELRGKRLPVMQVPLPFIPNRYKR